MVRENLIASAVSFLQDPSVASAPLEKKIAFLQSKNLTQEEIDLSLARASESSSSSSTATSPSTTQYNNAYRQSPASSPYGGYPPGYWQPQPPPPELPRRDWRDWFIMATVVGGVGYGLYVTAKRYVLPLIAPPTPPQLAQDKASLDESFNRAFALLDQLNTDTNALKASEEARTQRLDTALADVEAVLGSLKESSKRHDDESRRIGDDIRGLRDLIPKAISAQREMTDVKLRELSTELKSLKTLVGNRLNAGAAGSRPGAGTFGARGSTPSVNGQGTTSGSPLPSASAAEGSSTGTSSGDANNNVAAEGQSASSTMPERDQTSTPYGRTASGRASIPAWQMAAAKKDQASAEKKGAGESGTPATAEAAA